MKTLKELVEGFPFAKYSKAINVIFGLDYFIQNATQIVNDFNTYGHCVLQDNEKAYGLMFKDNSGDENDIYMKCHVYSWPQYGVIHGGKTFFCGTKNFGESLKEAIKEVR